MDVNNFEDPLQINGKKLRKKKRCFKVANKLNQKLYWNRKCIKIESKIKSKLYQPTSAFKDLPGLDHFKMKIIN